jgi:CheY-like chemotaxis protein
MQKKLACILLVDDNDSDNFLHRRIIEKAGIADNVEVRLNGQEALDFLAGPKVSSATGSVVNQPELILLDINMPVMDGWEFLERYNSSPEYRARQAVIIILSTSINPADRLKAEKTLGAGFFEYKPLTPATLQEIMKKHFPG